MKPVDVSAYTLLNYWDIMEYVTKNNLFIFNKDNNRQNNLSHSVNGGKNFKIKDCFHNISDNNINKFFCIYEDNKKEF